MINNAYLNRVFADLQKNHPNEPEFLQAVDEAVSYTHLTLPTT